MDFSDLTFMDQSYTIKMPPLKGLECCSIFRSHGQFLYVFNERNIAHFSDQCSKGPVLWIHGQGSCFFLHWWLQASQSPSIWQQHTHSQVAAFPGSQEVKAVTGSTTSVPC